MERPNAARAKDGVRSGRSLVPVAPRPAVAGFTASYRANAIIPSFRRSNALSGLASASDPVSRTGPSQSATRNRVGASWGSIISIRDAGISLFRAESAIHSLLGPLGESTRKSLSFRVFFDDTSARRSPNRRISRSFPCWQEFLATRGSTSTASSAMHSQNLRPRPSPTIHCLKWCYSVAKFRGSIVFER